ncbi:AzlC family ABC transporter permease [Thalassotalea sp. PP2-459]|uniref:AzlC family ABC transporter permease n=1 Tax=Thalassotalea sp. PP2-459 TaxID=1742724 RepID=UPI00094205F6|nr:AzlC family ABC transporter permease [Thalassotalea sp. PP2-459]OKY27962.1 branched-chain amino acid ABC transporter permease [Thalassotalea sp. PP2-459]
MQNIKKKYLLKGLLDMMPLNLAVLPWGILCGSLAIQRDFTVLEALLMPLIVFAGAAQLVSIELIAGNASLATILLTTFIISSRHFLYGLALRNKLKHLPKRWRLPLGFLLTDELFAFSGRKQAYRNNNRLYYALSAGGSFYITWFIWNLIGVMAGSFLPDLTELGLDFAIAVTFIALVVPGIKNFSILITVVVSGVLAIIFQLWHWQVGLVLSALGGMFAGYTVSQYQTRLRKVYQGVEK